jgi:hypothetical protein
VLHDDSHLNRFNLRYVPHSLEADQKPSPFELSRGLLQIVKQEQQDDFEHILTGDESLSFLNILNIRAGAQIQMTYLKCQSKNSIRKVAHFDYLG